MKEACAILRDKNSSLTWAILVSIGIIRITFTNLPFRMLQHTSSEVIIIQLQINLNSKIQLYALGTIQRNCHLRLALDHGSTETL